MSRLVLQAMTTLPWLALMIGNSRLHWAWFVGETLQQAWDTRHLSPDEIVCLTQHQLNFAVWLEQFAKPLEFPAFLANIPPHLSLWLAAVIPAQIPLWQQYARTQVITLDQIPVAKLYSTTGIDRALALLGAATVYGLPSLVIDAGTALTFTGADAAGKLVGGAILPGLQLQLRSLAEHTAALPQLSSPKHLPLPPRWTTNTVDAIWSGVLYTLLASLQDFISAWQQEFPNSAIVLTGGDATLLMELLHQQAPGLASQMSVDARLIFWGIRRVVC